MPLALAIVLIPTAQTPVRLPEILAGVGLTAAGEALRLWAVHHIGVISRTRSERLGPLVETGPFAYVRNPLYVGNILLWVGFSITAGMLWLAPIVLGLLAVEYHLIVKWEEALLESRLGNAYHDYCARVPRWIPTTTITKSSNDFRGFRGLRETLFSERGTLIAILLGYALLWLKARF